MGVVSRLNCSAMVELFNRISKEYHCQPNGVVVVGGMGFNVGGREVGRITDRPNGEVDVLYYSPGNERVLPVFSERFG